MLGGGTIDYSSRPQIDFDGKWLKWFVEFYDGEPYWEAWFLSSGTLTVTGSYMADAWLIGCGTIRRTSTYNYSRRGNAVTALGLNLTGSIPLTINDYRDDGSTTLGDLAEATIGDENEAPSSGQPYRFSDPDKANEAGENALSSSRPSGPTGEGGWLSWINYGVREVGQGYGAGGGFSDLPTPGACVVRIKI